MAWYDPLRELATEAFRKHPSPFGADTVLFYLACWCQKKAGRDGTAGDPKAPDLSSFDRNELAVVASAIAANLAVDGKQVEVLHAPGRIELDRLREQLLHSARRYQSGNAELYADDALMKIMTILLTGTNPVCCRCMVSGLRLERPGRSECRNCVRKLELDGPAGEYIFQVPFADWARAVTRHLVVDELGPPGGPRRRWREDLALVDEARYVRSFYGDLRLDITADRVLRGLLRGVKKLPPRQRSVMIESIFRADVDDLIYRRLYRLAKRILKGMIDSERCGSDREIGRKLGITTQNVRSNRCAGRKTLVKRNTSWREILNVILPHASPL
jgi:hypothetical protein